MKARWSVPYSAVLSLALVQLASAQLITVRTLPVAQADQFDIFPSQNLGMGGVSIALPDTLLDPFSNPAKAARLRTGRVFSAPGLYSVSSQAGGGRTLPLGALLRAGNWFGGLAVALQEVEPARRDFFFGGPILQGGIAPPGIPGPIGQINITPDTRSHGNTLGTLMLGTTLPGDVSIAGSVQFARLSAVDGVDLLYGNSMRVGQSGGSFDARIGLLREWGADQALEAVLVHNRYDMTHDVSYVDFVWDPDTQQPIGVPRLEQNLDRTNTWGLHFGYERPIPGTAWRVGGIATANRMSHPKIPNYEIMNIPRDPGSTEALNLGIGVSRRQGSETFGLDFVYEPMRSHTWAEAAGPVPTDNGGTIPDGGRTIENRFRFSNAHARLGFSWDLDPGSRDRGATMQLGLIVRAIRYRLDQENHISGSSRVQAESWTEWTPTWGLGLSFPTFEIRYRGRVTHGTGRPGVAQFGGCPNCARNDGVGGGIIAAPSGPLTLDPVRVVTHQISLALPLR